MIAKEKQTDPQFQHLTLQAICFNIIHVAKSIGIKITKDIDHEEFAKFYNMREKVVEDQKCQLAEVRAAKYVKK